jgi:F-type H+/Na+-transporting ATPase subunit alpha
MSINNTSTGKIRSIIDNIIIGTGLTECFLGEIINIQERFGSENKGYVMNVERTFVKIAIVQGSQTSIFAGDILYRTGKAVRTKVGFNVLGTIISPLGVLLSEDDSNLEKSIFNAITFNGYSDVFVRAPSIIERGTVARPFLTGITVVDCFIPIGCGQRELVIGDNNTGKTSFAITCIINQQRIVNGYYKV